MAVLLVCGTLALTGCGDKEGPARPSYRDAPSAVVLLTIVVEDNKTGTIKLIIVSRNGLGDPSDPTRAVWPELRNSASITALRVDRLSGFQASIAVGDMTRIDETLSQIGLADLFSNKQLLRRLTGHLGIPRWWQFYAVTATPPRAVEDLLARAGIPAELTRYRIRVDLPGSKITAHSAHWIENSVLTWEIDWSDGEPDILFGRTRAVLFFGPR